jgi:ADP-ribose pyrophosphatase
MENENLPESVLHEGRFLRYLRRGKWEFVQRPNVSGIVGIVAVTPEQKLILVEQFRIPVNAQVIELPAGLAGDTAGHENEPLENAAARELFEETGYEAGSFTRLTEGCVSAGVTDEIITLFRAGNLKKTGVGGGDENENIKIHEIPLKDVEAWLLERRKGGAVVDLKVYAGLYFARS